MTTKPKAYWDKIKHFLIIHENLSASLFFVMLILIFFFPIVFQGKTLTTSVLSGGVMPEGPYKYAGDRPSIFPVRDPGAFNWQDEPLLIYAGKIIKSTHQIPLWNPNMGIGYPIFAGFHLGITFPLNYLPSLFTAQSAWDTVFLIKFFFAGFLTYLFARKINLEKRSSLLAGTIFMFSGYSLAFFNMPHFNIEILIPLLLLSYEKFLEKQSFVHILLCVLVTVSTILPGMPEATAFALLLGGFWFIFSLFFLHKNIVKKIQTLLVFITINILAIALSAIQIIPFFEFLKLSFNSHAGTLIGLNAIPFGTITSMFYPYFFNPLYGWVACFSYVGIASLVLFFLAIFDIKKFENKEKGILIFFALFTFLMLAKVFGFSFINWTGSLPVFNLLIFPKYAAPAIIFSVAIVAALGYSLIIRKSVSFFNSKLFLVFIVMLLLTVFSLRQYKADIISRISETDPFAKNLFKHFITYFPVDFPKKFIDTISTSLTLPFLMFVIFAGIFIFLLFWIITFNTNKKLFPATTVLIFVIIELYIYTLPLERADRYGTFNKPPFVKYLQQDKSIFRTYGQMPNEQNAMLFPNTSSVFGIQDIRVLMALVDKRYFMFLKNVLGAEDEEVSSVRFVGNSQLSLDNKFFDLLNVKYFLLPSKISDPAVTNQIATGAKITNGDLAFFKPSSAVLNRKKLQGFMLHAPSEIEFSLEVKNNNLAFEYGLAETGIKKSDGVQFSVFAKNETGKAIQLFSDFVNPQDKKYTQWQSARLDLSAYKGKSITLSFRSEPGENNAFDQFYFGNFETSENNIIYEKEITIVENKDVLPRAFIVHQAKNISAPENIFTKLKADDFDIRKQIIIEKNLPENMLSGNNSPETDNSSAMITSYKDQEVLIDAKMENDGFLVLTDQYYPGWKAFVNEKETEIFPTDFIFRSIYLEKGQHQIKFIYDPLSYKIGKYISLTTAILLLTLFIFRKKIDQKISSHKKP